MTLLSLVGGFLAGITFRSFVDLDFSFGLLLFVCAGALGILSLQRGVRVFIIPACILFGIGVGILRFDISVGEPSPLFLLQVGETVALEGVVYREPEQRENGIRLYVRTDTLSGESTERGENIVMTAPFGEYRYGDRVHIEGVLTLPEPFETENERVFAYDKYLAHDNIFFIIGRPIVDVERSGEGVWIKEQLFRFKETLTGAISRIIPEPQASLTGGIVFGVEDALGERLLDIFRRSGLIHIIVLSGFNVAIAADWFMRLARFLPERMRLASGAIGIVLFALMTGASATTVRASIMALLALVARSTARRYAITRALFVAVVCMVLYDPHILMFDLSFQLSVLATLGLIYLAPLVEERIQFFPKMFDIRGLAAATISAQVAVLPLIAYQIGELSLVGLPANILVLPAIPWAMGTGFLTAIFGSVLPVLGIPFGVITYWLLSYAIAIATFVAGLPGAALSIPPFSWPLLIVMYGVLVFLVWRLSRRDFASHS